MSKRKVKFEKKRSLSRRHFLYMFLLVLTLFFGFLVVDLSSNEMLTGNKVSHLLSIKRQASSTSVVLMGKTFTVDSKEIQKYIGNIKSAITK